MTEPEQGRATAHGELAGKVALVTGASRGIGRAIVLAFAEAGADLALCARTEAALTRLAGECGARGRVALALPVDVAVAEQVQAAVDRVLDRFGRLDILVNNAGMTRDGLISRMRDEAWVDVLGTNLSGAFYFLRAASRIMMRQQSGKVINISSVVGLMGNAGQANYAASKAGLIGLTRAVAKELGSRNVQVNAIAPGFIETAMTEGLPDGVKQRLLERIPLGRFGQAEEVARAALFLAGSGSDYITGQVLSVCGGLLM